jgi:hypothetical protein
LGLAATATCAGDIPDPNLTPGALASTDLAEICESDGRAGNAYSRAHRTMNVGSPGQMYPIE